METECYLVSDFSDICHPHARSGECILMIFKLPRMIIRVVQMRCEKFRYFGELLIILKHPSVHRNIQHILPLPPVPECDFSKIILGTVYRCQNRLRQNMATIAVKSTIYGQNCIKYVIWRK